MNQFLEQRKLMYITVRVNRSSFALTKTFGDVTKANVLSLCVLNTHISSTFASYTCCEQSERTLPLQYSRVTVSIDLLSF